MKILDARYWILTIVLLGSSMRLEAAAPSVPTVPAPIINNAAGLGYVQTLGLRINTNSLFFYGANTSAVNNITVFWSPVFNAYTNGPAAQKRTVFLSPDNGHGVFTNASGLLCSNTVAGFTGINTWTNLSFPSNVNFSAESPLMVITNSPVLTNLLATNFYGQFGWVFSESTNFNDATNWTVTPGLFPVISTDHGATWKAGSVPKYQGPMPYGARDPYQTEKVNGLYGLAITTNQLALSSSAVLIKIGPTLSTMQDYTNLNFLLPGESITVPTNWYHWSPKLKWFKQLGMGIASASVSTNGGASFEIRMRTFADLRGPYGPTVVLNQTWSTNLIDMLMLWDWKRTNIVASVKNQQSGYMEIGSFATTNPASPFSFSAIGDFAFWGSGLEGWIWDEWTENGVNYTAGSTLFYLGPNAGNKGDAFLRLRAITTNSPAIGFSWSAMTNVVNPRDPTGRGYAQNFNPMTISTPAELAEATALVAASDVLKGRLELTPAGPPITNRLVKWGWPYNDSAAMPLPGYTASVGIGQQGLTFTSEGNTMLTVLMPSGKSNVVVDGVSNRVLIQGGLPLVMSTNVFSLFSVTNNSAGVGAALVWSNNVALTWVMWSNGVITYKQVIP